MEADCDASHGLQPAIENTVCFTFVFWQTCCY